MGQESPIQPSACGGLGANIPKQTLNLGFWALPEMFFWSGDIYKYILALYTMHYKVRS